VAVSEYADQVRERHRFSLERFRRSLGEQSPATILMEACRSAHYWGREAQTRGHRVVLLPPYAVRPYVVRHKTDRSMTPAITCGAEQREADVGFSRS
jgi:transposase